MRRGELPVLALLAALLGFASDAAACSIGVDELYQTDPTRLALDGTAPGIITNLTYEVERGEQSGGCGGQSSSCDDLGILQLHVTAPEDDLTAQDDLGYRVKVVDGAPPEGSSLPEDGATAFRGWGETRSSFTYVWIEDEGVAGEPFRFAVKVAAVDRAGNVGEWSEAFVIEDPGDNVFGCAVGGGTGEGRGLGLLFGVGVAIRLRRARLRRARVRGAARALARSSRSSASDPG